MEGKTFLITGGSNSIGCWTVRAVLENGVKHVIIFDKQENGDFKNEIYQKYGAEKYSFYNCNVTSDTEVDRALGQAISEHGHIDCIVNNTGVTQDCFYGKEIDVNYTGLVRMTIKALEHMRIDKGGRGGTVINVSSSVALEVDPRFLMSPVYCAISGAILHFTNCLASPETWETTGVRLMTVCYGPTETTMAYNGDVNGCLSKELPKLYEENMLQSPQIAVQSIIQAYTKGAHGSTWLSTRNRPPRDITEKIIQGMDLMAACM